ncbi:MAG: divergent PAP2 family protein [Dehalococcoidales bacterium]|nr:divergent PAP2 family protein [Dehalococcoidales bacterium]
MFVELLANKALIIPVCSWAIAQLLKLLITLIWKKQLDFRLLFVSGGMPSAHSATVTSLATVVADIAGLGSTAFAISVIFAIVVIYDAAGLRQSVGKQSIALNRILRELRAHRPINELGRDLREFMGHTELEVFVGSILGIVIALSWLAIEGLL